MSNNLNGLTTNTKGRINWVFGKFRRTKKYS